MSDWTESDEVQLVDVILHSLGLSNGGEIYRNYYCSESTPILEEAVVRGWMTGPREVGACAPYWHVTAEGIEAMGYLFSEGHDRSEREA